MIVIKKTLLRSIILLSFALLFVNCSKDSDSPNSSANTFLERFDNTSWNDDFQDIYIKFHNNILKPTDLWVQGTVGCYNYDNPLNSEEIIDIIENSRSTLIINYKYLNGLIIFTVEGETIKVSQSNGGDIQFIFLKTTNAITYGLTICD